jgi:molecular chaperone GrpE
MSKKEENLKHSDEEELEIPDADELNGDDKAQAEAEEAAAEQSAQKAEAEGKPEEEPDKCDERKEHKQGKDKGKQDGKDKAKGKDKAQVELEKAQAAAEDYKRKWYLVSAEYDNYRKRNASAVAQAYADGKAEAILKLLPVADTFGYAYDGASDEKTKAGIDKIVKNFNTILKSLGVEEVLINVGDPFDEGLAEAIMNVPCEEGETPNSVKQVLKKGYKQGDKVIRFAQVIVTI